MSDSDDEEYDNSTRKFTAGLRPDNFADQKFERETPFELSVNTHCRDTSLDSPCSENSSDYQTCQLYLSPHPRVQVKRPIEVLQDQCCLSPLILKKQENDLLRSGQKTFTLGSSLKKVRPCSQDTELVINGDTDEDHESFLRPVILEDENEDKTTPIAHSPEYQSLRKKSLHLNIQSSNLAANRPKCLAVQMAPASFEYEDTPILKKENTLDLRSTEVFEYTKRQRCSDSEGS
jgi:hypothetical protein